MAFVTNLMEEELLEILTETDRQTDRKAQDRELCQVRENRHTQN